MNLQLDHKFLSRVLQRIFIWFLGCQKNAIAELTRDRLRTLTKREEAEEAGEEKLIFSLKNFAQSPYFFPGSDFLQENNKCLLL
ncbi:MAG: hypothetical protein QNJ72_06290 [Pleurocapsa sp. MO_226.B13]|nr:hypothetical protein [Pleurocapsa sp. MO_226.B13]